MHVFDKHYGLSIERHSISLGRDTVAEKMEILQLESEVDRFGSIQQARKTQLDGYIVANFDDPYAHERQLQSIIANGVGNRVQEMLNNNRSIQEVRAVKQDIAPTPNLPQVGDLADRVQRDESARGIYSPGPNTSFLLPGAPGSQGMLAAPNSPQMGNRMLFNTVPGGVVPPQPLYSGMPASSNPAQTNGGQWPNPVPGQPSYPGMPAAPNLAQMNGGQWPNPVPGQPSYPGMPAAPNPAQMNGGHQTLRQASTGRYRCVKLGFIAEELTPLQREKLEGEQNLAPPAFVVTDINPSGAANGKLQPGDYLVQIAGVSITDATLLMKAEYEAPSVPKLIVRVLRAEVGLAFLLWDRAFPSV